MRRADQSSRGVLPSLVPPMSATAKHRKGGGHDPESDRSSTEKKIYSIGYLVYLLILQLFMQKKNTENFRIQVFCDVTRCLWIKSTRRFERPWCL